MIASVRSLIKKCRCAAIIAGPAIINPIVLVFRCQNTELLKTSGELLSPPTLGYIIRGYIYDWSMILGFVIILVLILRKQYIYKTAILMSIIWGGIGIYYAYIAFFIDKSDRNLYMGIIPVLGLFMAIYHLKKEDSHGRRPLLFIPGIGLCISALVMDVIYLINYPIIHVWIIAVTIIVPAGIVIYGIYHRMRKISLN